MKDLRRALVDIYQRLTETDRRLDRLEVREGTRLQFCTDNVADPPTDAELDTAFGTPATVGQGFIGIVDDDDADTDVWLCYTNGTSWFHLQGTKAL